MLARGGVTRILAAIGCIMASASEARAQEASPGSASASAPSADAHRPSPVTVLPVLRLGTALLGSIGATAVASFDAGGCGHLAFTRGLLVRPEIGIRGLKTDVGVGAVFIGECRSSPPLFSFMPLTLGFSLAASWVHWWSQQQPDLVLTPTGPSTVDLLGGTLGLAMLAGFEVGLYTDLRARTALITVALTFGL